MASADPGQRVADEHVDDAGAAERRAEHDDALGLGRDLADARRVAARAGVRASPRSAASASSGATTATTLPSLATYQRIDPEEVARAVHRRERPGGRPRRGRRPGSVSRASSLQTVPTPPRVGIAQPPRRRRRGQEGVDQRRRRARCRSGCRPRARGRRGRASPPSRGRRWCPTRARRHPARTRSAPSIRPAGMTPTPAVVTYMPSAAPRSTTLVSPVTIVHVGGPGRVGHVGHDAAQLVDREPLLEHERRRQPAGLRRPAPRGRSRCRAPRGGRWSRPGTAAVAPRTSRC